MLARAEAGPGSGMTGHTNWRRAAVILIPGMVAVGVLGSAMAQGAIPAAVGVSGDHFVVTADRVDGRSVIGYPHTSRASSGKAEESVLLGMRSVRITDLCLSARADVPVVGPVALVLQSGAEGDVTVSNFVASATSIEGADGQLGDFAVGVDASTLRDVPGAQGPPGTFGIRADSLSTKNFRSTTSAITGGKFSLSGLKLGVRRGSRDAC
jgi:hypothetical protein